MIKKLRQIKLKRDYIFLLLVCALLCVAGFIRLTVTRFFPFETFIISQGFATRFINSKEEVMQITFYTDEFDMHNRHEFTIKNILDNIIISAKHSVNKGHHYWDFSVGSKYNHNTLLEGIFYSDADIAYFYIPMFFNKPLIVNKEIEDEVSFVPFNNLSDYINIIKNGANGRLSKDKDIFVTTLDRGYNNEYNMDNFTLELSGENFNTLLLSLAHTMKHDNELNGALCDYISELFGDKVDENTVIKIFHEVIGIMEDIANDVQFFNQLFIKYQIDDLFRLRGVHAEFHLNNMVVVYDMNITKINNVSVPEPMDTSDGISLWDISEGDLLDFFEPLLS